MGGGDGVEKVNGCVPHGMVAVDVEKLAAGAVKAVEGRLVGIDGGASAELARLRLMIPKSRSTTRKNGSPQAR